MDGPVLAYPPASHDFNQLADMVIHVPTSASGIVGEAAAAASSGDGQQQAAQPPDQQQAQPAVTEALRVHSQVLGQWSSVIAGMLASLADPASGTACSPVQPLDVTHLFQGASRQAVLLFLACAYAGPSAVDVQLQRGAADKPLGTLFHVIRLMHRLDARCLLKAALAWSDYSTNELYAADPTGWLKLAEELQLDELRLGVVARLFECVTAPGQAAIVVQRLDLSSLQKETAAMLLDGFVSMAAGCREYPGDEDVRGWTGPGSFCEAAARRERLAAMTAYAVGGVSDDEEDAQQQQAQDDWDAEFDEMEGADPYEAEDD